MSSMSRAQSKRTEFPYNPQILLFAQRAASIMSRLPGGDLLYLLFGLLLLPFIKVMFFWLNKIEVRGFNNIPRSEHGIFFLCNHVSAVDGPVLAAILWPRPLWFASKESLYRRWFTSLIWMLITTMHTFPVRRNMWDETSVKFIKYLICKRKNVVIFPEGTRSRTGMIQRGKAGVGLIIIRVRPIVVPVLINGLERIFPLRRRFIPSIGQKALVQFGKPMDLSSWWEEPNNKETGQKIVDSVMSKICQMKEELGIVSLREQRSVRLK